MSIGTIRARSRAGRWARRAGRGAQADRQPAQAVVVAALALVAVLAFVGLVVNMGLYLVERRHLQNAADAIALAATWRVLDEQTSGVLLDAAVAAEVTSLATANGIGSNRTVTATYVNSTGSVRSQVGSLPACVSPGPCTMPMDAAGVQVSVAGTFTTLLAGFVGQNSIPVSANSQARLVHTQPIGVANLVPLAISLADYQANVTTISYASAFFLDLTSAGTAWPTYGDPSHNLQYWSDGSHLSGQLSPNSKVTLIPALPGYVYNIQAGLLDNATRQHLPNDPLDMAVSTSSYLLVTLPVCSDCTSSAPKGTIVGFGRFRINTSDITPTIPPVPPTSLLGTFVPFVTNPLTPFIRAPGPASGTVAVALTN